MTITLTPFRDGMAHDAEPYDEATLRSLRGDPDVLLWIDVDEATADDFATLERELDLPELAVESAREGRQRPKLDTYEDCALIVAYAARIRDHAARRRLRLTEFSLFVGRRFLVTVRTDAAPKDHPLRHRLIATGGRPLRSSTAMAHAVLDSIVDDYFVTLEDIEQHIEDVDQQAYQGLDDKGVARAFALRRDLVRFRRVVGPLREVLNGMVRRQGSVLDDTVDEHLRDLYDHVVTVYEDIEMTRDLLAGSLEAPPVGGLQSHELDRPEGERLGGDHRRAHRDRQHLRHELQAHAGAGLVAWAIPERYCSCSAPPWAST